MTETPIKPITTSSFYVEFDGIQEQMIKSVQEIAFQGQVKGNEQALASTKNGMVLRQSTATGFEENPNFTIEVYLREDDMTFYKWMLSVMPKSYPGGLGQWAQNRKNGSITGYNSDGEMVLRWEIKRAWIKSYKVSDFAADGTDLAVETLELVCEDIRRVK